MRKSSGMAFVASTGENDDRPGSTSTRLSLRDSHRIPERAKKQGPTGAPTMFVGPLCYFELVRMARRGRLFALRLVFGLVLLGILAVNYLGHSRSMPLWSSPEAFSIAEMARFGQTLFASIMAAQAALVLVLTPALVADAIASERQRKTLDHLLASPLDSREIVLGKLASRVLGVGVFPALVLPIMSLLTLVLGGSWERQGRSCEPGHLVACRNHFGSEPGLIAGERLHACGHQMPQAAKPFRGSSDFEICLCASRTDRKLPSGRSPVVASRLSTT